MLRPLEKAAVGGFAHGRRPKSARNAVREVNLGRPEQHLLDTYLGRYLRCLTESGTLDAV